jgi:hypothetical protein
MTPAGYGRRLPPPDRPASIGDKIAAWPIKAAQLAAELRALGTDARERLFALKFPLHFVDDMPTAAARVGQ